MSETQLLELLRVQLQAEADAKQAYDRLSDEEQSLAARMNNQAQLSRRIHRDLMRTQYRIVEVLRGLPDPGPKEDA